MNPIENIIEIEPSRLVPYINNPRHNEGAVSAVAESIHKFGFKQPIVVDKNLCVIVGHTRLAAAKILGLEKVPCVIAEDLDETQAKAYRLVDNKTAEFAEWDESSLRDELKELAEEGINLEREYSVDFGLRDYSFDDDDAPKTIDVQDSEIISTDAPTEEETVCRCPRCGYAITKDDECDTEEDYEEEDDEY